MNRFEGVISGVESADSISLVDVAVGSDTFSSIVLESGTTFISPGKRVFLYFKETEVSISKDPGCRISLRNRIKARVKDVEKGKVLSRVVLDYRGTEIVSVITSRSVERLEIAPGDEVEGMVKANEMILADAGDGRA